TLAKCYMRCCRHPDWASSKDWLPAVSRVRKDAVEHPLRQRGIGCLPATGTSSRRARQAEPAGPEAGGLFRQECRGSELGRQVAVDFKSDADFHERGSRPVHSCLPTLLGRLFSQLTWRN